MQQVDHHRRLAAIMGLLLAIQPAMAAAQETVSSNTAAQGYCKDRDTVGWNFYCEDSIPQEEPVEEPVPAPVMDPPPPPDKPDELPEVAPAPPSYTDQMMAFRANIDELKHRAILVPTPQNVQAYMRAQDEAVQMAGLFTEVWQRNLFSNPDLDANVKRPLATVGSQIRQDQRNAERESALNYAATEMGLLYVYEGPAHCLVCDTQSQIVADMMVRYGIDVLAVSGDGHIAPEFPQSVVDQGQLARLGLRDHPKPLFALVDPRNDAVILIGAGLMTQDVLLERVRIIVSVPEGELYE